MIIIHNILLIIQNTINNIFGNKTIINFNDDDNDDDDDDDVIDVDEELYYCNLCYICRLLIIFITVPYKIKKIN